MSYGNGVDYQAQTGQTTALQPPQNLNNINLNDLLQQFGGNMPHIPMPQSGGMPQQPQHNWQYQGPQPIANSGVSQYAGGTPQGRAGASLGGMITGIGNAPVANGPGTQPVPPVTTQQPPAPTGPFMPPQGPAQPTPTPAPVLDPNPTSPVPVSGPTQPPIYPIQPTQPIAQPGPITGPAPTPNPSPIAPQPPPSNPGNINFGGGNFAPTIDTYKPFNPGTPTPGPDGSMMLNGGGFGGGGGVQGQFAGTDAQGNPVYFGTSSPGGGSQAMMQGYFDANGNSIGSFGYQVANPYSGFQSFGLPGSISTGPVQSTNYAVSPALQAAGLSQ
jgi:hypothetical protein